MTEDHWPEAAGSKASAADGIIHPLMSSKSSANLRGLYDGKAAAPPPRYSVPRMCSQVWIPRLFMAKGL